MDPRLIQVYRGTMLLLAHSDRDLRLIGEAQIVDAVKVAHQALGIVEDVMARQPVGPVSVARSFDNAA